MTQDVMDMPPQQDEDELPDAVPVPGALVPHLSECALLLDIDGTLLDFAPTPREVWVPPGLAKTLNRLLQRTSGALALVSGRSLNDIDLIFAPAEYPAVGGHGAEMRLSGRGGAGEGGGSGGAPGGLRRRAGRHRRWTRI